MVRKRSVLPKDDKEEIYFRELYDRITDGRCVTISYYKLFRLLHDVEFSWSILMDKNRYSDGIQMRRELGFEDVKDGCSVLEMMIALCIRAETEIMDNPQIGDRTGNWFFRMLNNMGISTYDDNHFDEDECLEIINRFLDREYEPNGKGGLFYIRNTTADLRNMEIWIQMLWYMDTLS